MTVNDIPWANLLTGVNVITLLVAIRRMSRLELMVETMWDSFKAGGWFHSSSNEAHDED